MEKNFNGVASSQFEGCYKTPNGLVLEIIYAGANERLNGCDAKLEDLHKNRAQRP